jgi:hypothetical protein
MNTNIRTQMKLHRSGRWCPSEWIVAFLVAMLAVGSQAGAQSCTSEPVPYVYVYKPNVLSNTSLQESAANWFWEAFFSGLTEEFGSPGVPSNRIILHDYKTADALLGLNRTQQRFGTEGGETATEDELVGEFGDEYLATLSIGRIGNSRQVNVSIANAKTMVIVASARETLPDDDGLAFDQLKSLTRRHFPNLDCLLRNARVRPVLPSVRLTLTPATVRPNEPMTATAVLIDRADGTTQIGHPLTFTHLPPGGSRVMTLATTDSSGTARQQIAAGAFVANTPGKVRATYVRIADNVISPLAEQPYSVIPSRHLSVSASRVKLRLNDLARIDLALNRNGTPSGGAPLTLSASAGLLGAASVTTSAQGTAQVSYTSPAAPAVVSIHASAPPDPGTTTPIESQLTLIADAGIVMEVATADTSVSSPSMVTVDIEQDGQPLVGAAVNFQLRGSGVLDAATATTTSVGRATVSFTAPPQPGASTITVSLVIAGQTYSRTATIRYTDSRDALTREIAEVVQLVRSNPSDANLQRLLNLKTRLIGLNQRSRSEQMLDQVDGNLYCVHQKSDDMCRSGSGLASVQPTLSLLKSLGTGSALLEGSGLVTRVDDTTKICPYPAFMQGAVYDEAATIRPGATSASTETGEAYLAISAWSGSTPTHLSFGFSQTLPGLPTYFVRGPIVLISRQSPFSGTIGNGVDVFGYSGSRANIIDYQSSATSPTVHVTVNGPTVTGTFDLYRYTDQFGNDQIASASMSATVQFPAAPTYGCGSTPQGGGD